MLLHWYIFTHIPNGLILLFGLRESFNVWVWVCLCSPLTPIWCYFFFTSAMVKRRTWLSAKIQSVSCSDHCVCVCVHFCSIACSTTENETMMTWRQRKEYQTTNILCDILVQNKTNIFYQQQVYIPHSQSPPVFFYLHKWTCMFS